MQKRAMRQIFAANMMKCWIDFNNWYSTQQI